MKQTRTTLKALTAAYRAVLRHGILCNAIALGLIATATPAMAETVTSQQVIQDTQVLSGISASNLSNDPGAVYWVYNGDLTLNDSSFVGNTAAGSYGLGGVIYNDGTATINTSTFTGNSSTEWGGAIASYGNLTISDSTFGGTGDGDVNTSGVGGAIMAGGGSLTINNGTGFYNNKATGTDGGAVWTSNAGVSVSNTTFDGNTAARNGGAVYKTEDGNLSVSNSVFTKNTATGDAGIGGAVVIDQYNTGTVLFDNVTFGDGTAAGANNADEAGAIWLGTAGTIKNSTFNYNTAHDGGAVVTGGSGQLTLNNSKFLNNVADGTDGNGGAIATRKKDAAGTSFLHITGDGTDATMFANNSAANGGAIYTGTNDTTIADTKFVGNTATANGGAIYNEGTLALTDSVFGDKDSNSQLLRNIAENGGAIYNTGDLTVNGGAFYRNTANAGTKEVSGGGAIYNLGTLTTNSDFIGNSTLNTDTGRGGAIWNKGDLTVTGGTYVGNISGVRGGAINISDGTVSIENTTFGGDSFALRNTANNGGAIAMNKGTVSVTDTTIKNNYASSAGGAIYNNKGTLNITGGTFTGNTANERGGAIFDNSGSLTLTNSVIENNSTAGHGAGIYNDEGVITLTDTVVKDNVIDSVRDASGSVKGKGAGIYNAASGMVTVNATNKDITFSGNKVKVDDGDNGVTIYEDDIYNRGALILNAAANRTLALDGGIDGNGSGIMVVNEDVANTGVVKVAGTLNGQNVTVAHGELHLIDDDPVLAENPGAYLAGSTINVESGATINTIDDVIQDLSSVVTLANGAGIKGDIDWNNGTADKYASDAGTVKYYVGNLLNGNIGKGEKAFQVVSNGTTVDINEAKFTSDTGATFLSSGVADGQMIVRGFAGGINTAVETTDANGARLALNYTVTENEVFDSDDSIDNSDFRITGTGVDGLAIELQKDLNVSEDAVLSLNDVKFTGSSDIVNKAGAVLNIKDSRIAVNVNNYGTMVSDPTYYDAKVVNVGTASFTGDVFESGSSLTNSAIVDLNNVEFKSGSSLIGNTGNTLNLVGTGNIFNGSSTGNNVVLASGANYTGTLYDGVVDARNGGIDTITGSVSGGNLYVDANLTSGEVDTFGGTSGATIKGIKLANAGYGTEDKVELAIGEATLANDLNIDGMNYYTSVVKDGDNIVFSDKLINESNLYSKLGSWTGGNYIATSADMENVADGENYMTVGQALSALDTNLKTVSTAGTIAAGQTGFVTGDAVYNAFASQTASAVDLHNSIAAIMATDASANTKRGALGQLLMTGTVAGQNLTAYTTAEAMASLVTLTGEAMSEYDFGWDINKGLQNDLDNDGKYRIDVLNDSNVQDKTVAGAINANTSAISANADAIATLNDAENVAGSVRNIAKGYADETLSAANGYTDAAIENALGAVTEGVTAVYDHAHEWAEDLLGVDVDADVETQLQTALDALAAADGTDNNLESTTIAGALHELDVTSAANAEAIETLNSDEDVDGSVKNIAKGYADAAVESAKDYTDTALTNAVADGGVVDTAIDNAITAAVGENGAVATAINNATKMGADDDDSTSMFAHFDEGASVTDAAAALDTAVSATESDIATLKGEEGTAGSVKNTAKGYADTAENNAKTFATSAVDSLANGAVADNTAALSLLNGDANTEGSVAYAAANAVATANAYTDSKLNEVRDSAVAASNAYTDRRIEDLDKNLSAGVAGAVALSSVAVSGVERGEVSVGAGYGYFNGQSAAAFGATMGLSNRWSVNAGAGISNADVSFRAGTNYKFKLF